MQLKAACRRLVCLRMSPTYRVNALCRAGAARAVSRRYIADFVSKRERTKASAAFVGSSAMGMALGPLLARLFQSFPTVHFGPFTFNYITMGACALPALDSATPQRFDDTLMPGAVCPKLLHCIACEHCLQAASPIISSMRACLRHMDLVA